MELDKVVGTGAQATVYCSGNYAIKLFKENCSKTEVFYEALINSIIENTGLNIPKTHEVLKIGNQMAIKMDYIKGVSLADSILKDLGKAEIYIENMVTLQLEMHSKKEFLPFSLKDKLKGKIQSNQCLEQIQKEKLLKLLNELPGGERLCHGDFHGHNILLSEEKYWIIDWIDSSYGCTDGDACRTYMIHCLYAPPLAEMYLNIYCEHAHREKNDILKWLPVIAAARLSENIPNEKEMIMSWINAHD